MWKTATNSIWGVILQPNKFAIFVLVYGISSHDKILQIQLDIMQRTDWQYKLNLK